MNRNELLHRLAEGETVSVHDVDECIREEKERLTNEIIEWIYDKSSDGFISFDKGHSEVLMQELKSHLAH